MFRLIRTAQMALLTGCLCVLSAAGGCDRPTAQSKLPARAADATYTMRARVESLPEAGNPLSEFVVFHEPVDTFFDPRAGRIVGMNSMSMPFSNLAPGVSPAGLTVGDAVEMTFAVWYKTDVVDPAKQVIDTYVVQRLTKLPAGTELKFGRASPPLGGP